ncbi:hypothetical protein ACI2IX_20165 [Leifsonia aquatica]|uniref:hypothetical protein n=1 Tax=Leifsonia aquatica TaxID=144185 RepID=UPI00384EE337
MAKGSNAGVHRNRGPAGEKTKPEKVGLLESRWKEVDAVRGKLSRGLYFEKVLREVAQLNGGALPTFDPTIAGLKEGAEKAVA